MRDVSWTVSIDAGGTFTDATAKATDGRAVVAKVASTPHDPAAGLSAAIAELVSQGVDADRVTLVAHGTTIATNAVLTGQLASVCLIATDGFRDVLAYRNGSRPDVYSLEPTRPDPLVPRSRRIGVRERMDSSGTPVVPLTDAEIERVVTRIREVRPDAIAVSLLFSYVDDAHEQALGHALRAAFPGTPVALSCEVAREFREYPRTATAVINAALRPVVGSYLERADRQVSESLHAPLAVMQSNGGCVSAERADVEAHRLILSGPSGGAAGLIATAHRHDVDNIIGLDMGGTSTDVCLVRGGGLPLTSTQDVQDHTILSPSVDIDTVGAGGGSIAWVDGTGQLRVGPHSARAVPGPACYGRGGTDATVSDAHAVLGTLGASDLAGGLSLDREAARTVVGALGERLGSGVEDTADAIITLAVAHTIRALRRVSVERGLDPREFTLVPFGGAGPLHAGLFLRHMGLRSVLIPRWPGVFASDGMLTAGVRVDDAQTVLETTRDTDAVRLGEWFAHRSDALSKQVASDGVMTGDIRVTMSIDCRYVGQGYELPVTVNSWDRETLERVTEGFHAEHRRLYGHANEHEDVELVTLRISVIGSFPEVREPDLERGDGDPEPAALLGHREIRIPGNAGYLNAAVWDRSRLRARDILHGPCVVTQMDSTTVVAPGQTVLVEDNGDLAITEATRSDAGESIVGAREDGELDAVSFAVLSSALTSVADEMGGVIKHSTYSPIIRDMDDFSCAVFTENGDLVAQADYIPAQLGAMSLVVKSVLERWDGDITDGDAYVCNDPYLGAMHLPDVNIVVPVFCDGDLIAWTGTAAHHIDVGGVRPGSEGPDLEEIFAEGLVLPPVRLAIAGVENRDVVELLTSNIRDPLSTVSDLRAQRAACALGRDRILELVGKHGRGVVRTVLRRMLDAVESAVRTSLEALPDGTSEAVGYLDDDGRDGPPTKVNVVVTKRGDCLEVDLSRSAPQVAGAMNVPWASARAGVVYAVRSVVAPELGSNDGILRALDIICPRGNVLNPEPPAAVSVRHNTCQRLADTLIRAMSQLWPERAVGSSTVSFVGFNVGSSSPVDGRSSVMADVVGGGTGATRHGDGVDGVDTYMSNVGLMSAEVAETNYQVRVLRTDLLPGSQGQGEFSGGLGVLREYEILNHPQRVTAYAEQTNPDFAPRGAADGDPAKPTRLEVLMPDGHPLDVDGKVSLTLPPGAVVRVATAGGAGYGDHTKRRAELQRLDHEDERLG